MKNNPSRQEILDLRKRLWLGIPAIFLMLGLAYLVGMPEIKTTVSDLMNQSATVRISVAVFGTFFLVPLLILVLIIVVLKCIPIRWGGMNFIVKLLNINIFAAAAFMIVGVPVLTFLQYHYMPQLGYSKCNILRGHPNMWFNDWVKNPEWCVQGKDRAWVLQQAQKIK
ncbi:hypothetical protein [Acidovorax sp. SUPP3334]|uniref:hypothetical protein n=1 Tax=Acidovorax sp. SUPP3334 TaxID=2920881 RepID=UPI0023DE41E4|nr:hypothetical protein [Acidovorax sp. SUPP3334]GKT21895.1 hypothetical protein AVHM3334_06435 [Acidovorax sp. SUPP3334]